MILGTEHIIVTTTILLIITLIITVLIITILGIALIITPTGILHIITTTAIGAVTTMAIGTVIMMAIMTVHGITITTTIMTTPIHREHMDTEIALHLTEMEIIELIIQTRQEIVALQETTQDQLQTQTEHLL